jgi:hypothetical protein
VKGHNRLNVLKAVPRGTVLVTETNHCTHECEANENLNNFVLANLVHVVSNSYVIFQIIFSCHFYVEISIRDNTGFYA